MELNVNYKPRSVSFTTVDETINITEEIFNELISLEFPITGTVVKSSSLN